MTTLEALTILQQVPNKPIGQIFSNQDLSDVISNKGRTGQLLETIILKLKLSNTHLDFSDGELKTNKCHSDGKPAETLAVCQIASMFDDMITDNYDCTNNRIIEKMSNMIYMGIDKDDVNPVNWKFFSPQLITKGNKKYDAWFKQVYNDLQDICHHMRVKCDAGQKICSTRGPRHYIQIRPKDSVPYSPIYSTTYGRFVSDKNFAIYITTDGIRAFRGVK